MKRILLTGAGGFIGRPVAETLCRDGHEVHAICRAGSFGRLPREVTGHAGDLFDTPGVRRLLVDVRPEILIHLAWHTDPDTYWESPSNLDWREASLHLFRCFLDAGGEACLAAGTSAEYDWRAAGPFEEERSVIGPRGLYGEAKSSTFRAGSELFGERAVPFIWARFFCPFGPREDVRRLIPKTCIRLLRGEKLTFDAATQVRDFLHVDDVAAAVAALGQTSASGPVNVASGESRSIREVISEIAKSLQREDSVAFSALASPPDGPASITASVERLRDLTHWRPAATFSQRVAATCEWWRAAEKLSPS